MAHKLTNGLKTDIELITLEFVHNKDALFSGCKGTECPAILSQQVPPSNTEGKRTYGSNAYNPEPKGFFRTIFHFSFI
jgi:hypothetical protein